MATVEEARQQITQQRQQLETSRQQIQQQEQQVRQAQLDRLSRAELQQRTRADILRRKLQQQELGARKQQALREFTPIREDLSSAEEQVRTFEREVNRVAAINESITKFNSDLAIARKYFFRDKFPRGETKRIQKLVREMQEGTQFKEKGIIIHIGNVPHTIKEKTKQLSIISVAPKGIERIRGQLQAFKLDTERKVSGVIRNFLSKVDLSISERAIKETPITSIQLPTTIPGATIQTRPVDFRDIDTGRLPPKQNLELATTQIIQNFNQGRVTEEKAIQNLKAAQKIFILTEARRTAPARFIEGVAIGATTIIAPPLGFTLIGLEGGKAISQRKQIIAFAKENPKAAAAQFVAGVVGGFVGAGGASAVGIKSTILKDPKLTLRGASRIKAINTLLKNLETGQAERLKPQIKQTSTRVFEFDVPSPNNRVKLQIIEFGKAPKRRFFGWEIVNNKVIGGVGGETIAKSGTDSIGKLVTRSFRFHSKGGLTNVELAEYLERATTKSAKIKEKIFELTNSEVRLSQKFKLGGLTTNQAREVLRRPLFGIKEAQRRINKPFTSSEFNRAFKLSKSRVLIEKKLVKAKFTEINTQLAPLLAKRRSLDLRFIERGKGLVDIEVRLPKGRVTGVQPKAIGLKGVIKIPITTTTKRFKISRGKVIETKPKTPLSKTFTQQTQDILLKKISPKKKVSLLKQLETKVSATGAFKAIAKTIQKEQITSAIKQAKKRVPITAAIISLKGLPRMVGGEGLTEAQLRRQGGGLSESFEFLDIPPSAHKTFTRPQRLVKFGQLDFNKPPIAKDIDKILQIRKLSVAQLGKFRTLLKQGARTLVRTQQKNQQLIRSKIRLAEGLALGGKITTVQVTKLKQRLINRQLIRQRPIAKLIARPIIPPPPPIIKIPEGVTRTDLVSALTGIKKGTGVNILTGMKIGKQKIIGKNLPPFKALKRGSRFVDKNIQASFKLVPTGKKAKTKDIVPFNVGFKFRPSKVNPLFIVEKRKFRLDSPFEVRQIKRAKASKPRKRKVKGRKKK